uniref:Uncharacterized protein n=1 Tax=Papio anubis TaxID=9555 RepID=A0A8I5NA23_PAPAN
MLSCVSGSPWRTHAASIGRAPDLCYDGGKSAKGVLLCHPGWSTVALSQLPATSASRVQAILLPQCLSSWDYRHASPHPANFYIFSRDSYCCLYYVGQAGLELLTSCCLPTLASQSAGITGVSHYPWP